MKPKHQIKQDGDRQIIIRNEYPRFTGEITFSALSDITNVKVKDTDATAGELAKAMREAADYIWSQRDIIDRTF